MSLALVVLRQSQPFFVTIGYTGLIMFMEDASLLDRVKLGKSVFHAGRRWTMGHNAFLFMAEHIVGIPSWSVWSGKAADMAKWSKDLNERFDGAHRDLTFGNAQLGIYPVDDKSTQPELFHLLFENACLGACQAHPSLLVSKAMRNGLQLGVERFSESLLLGVERKFALLENETLREEWQSTSHFELDAFLDEYHESNVVAEALEEAMRIYSSDLHELFGVQLLWSRITLACFIAILFASAYQVYRSFKSMNQRTQDLQFLLVVLPASVINTPEIRRILFEEVAHRH